MKHRKLTLSIVTAAALAAFGAVNAHDANTDANVSFDPTISVPSDTRISSSTSVDSSTDIGASESMSGDVSASTGATESSSDSMSSLPSDSNTGPEASITDEERLKGLDRADQVAGVHGEHGRDTAREHQERN